MVDGQASREALRFQEIDLLRGIIMVLMTLDHVRDYAWGAAVGDPMRVGEVSGGMFVTRFLSHFCAPLFIVLAGMSARFLQLKGMSTAELSRHLALRGALLVVLEVTVVDLAWNFYPPYPITYLQIIWAIGWSMVFLAILVRLPMVAIGTAGGVLTVGHGVIEALRPAELHGWGYVWFSVLFEKNVLDTGLGFAVRTTYPLVAPMGLIAIGYVLGGCYAPGVSQAQRRKVWVVAAITGLLAYAVLRLTHLGDPHPFVAFDNPWWTLMSFFNPTKYPLSLQFVLLTVSPGLLWLTITEVPRWTRPLLALGRVPLFYYIVHLYVIHAAMLGLAFLQGFGPQTMDFQARLGGVPEGFGLPLWAVYVTAGAISAALVPLCDLYGRARSRYGGFLRFF
ncbi:MAG: heparan-alpha-glucosaminide N-acetyltransferase domain-containing protein [Myxococcota bacterium]